MSPALLVAASLCRRLARAVSCFAQVADPETYLHRVGRTGRFGRKGVALNLIHDDKEMKVLKQIEIYFNREGLISEIPQTADPEEFEKLLVPS